MFELLNALLFEQLVFGFDFARANNQLGFEVLGVAFLNLIFFDLDQACSPTQRQRKTKYFEQRGDAGFAKGTAPFLICLSSVSIFYCLLSNLSIPLFVSLFFSFLSYLRPR